MGASALSSADGILIFFGALEPNPWQCDDAVQAALAGFIGSRDRREYTVVGPTLNLAARVQTLTREHRRDILLTESVREQLDPRFELTPMPAVPVKGIGEPVVTYAVLGGRDAQVRELGTEQLSQNQVGPKLSL